MPHGSTLPHTGDPSRARRWRAAWRHGAILGGVAELHLFTLALLLRPAPPYWPTTTLLRGDATPLARAARQAASREPAFAITQAFPVGTGGKPRTHVACRRRTTPARGNARRCASRCASHRAEPSRRLPHHPRRRGRDAVGATCAPAGFGRAITYRHPAAHRTEPAAAGASDDHRQPLQVRTHEDGAQRQPVRHAPAGGTCARR